LGFGCGFVMSFRSVLRATLVTANVTLAVAQLPEMSGQKPAASSSFGGSGTLGSLGSPLGRSLGSGSPLGGSALGAGSPLGGSPLGRPTQGTASTVGALGGRPLGPLGSPLSGRPLGGGLGPLTGAAPGAPLGALGGGQGGLPTLNLLGGASQTPSNIAQLQDRKLQDPKIDSICPGVDRRATDVGPECWQAIWVDGGCKAENAPDYVPWHRAQTLEVLVADVVQWANLPDERHQQGCRGDAGQPPAEPTSLTPTAGAVDQSLPADIEQKVRSVLDSDELTTMCPGVGRQATNVGEECWRQLWIHMGCLEATVPEYGQWHSSQSLEVLVVDVAQWAGLPGEKYTTTCFGADTAAIQNEQAEL